LRIILTFYIALILDIFNFRVNLTVDMYEGKFAVYMSLYIEMFTHKHVVIIKYINNNKIVV